MDFKKINSSALEKHGTAKFNVDVKDVKRGTFEYADGP